MKIFSIHSVRNFLAVVIALGIGYVAYTINPSAVAPTKVQAGATTENVTGWAWSDTIGWISFNNTTDDVSGPNYGVNVGTTNRTSGGSNNITGYAWIGNNDGANATTTGWISFDRAVTGNPPGLPFNDGVSAIAQVNWSTGKVTGWARAISGCQMTSGTPATSCVPTPGFGAGAITGGWDGWIKLSDDAVTSWLNKGVRISGNKFAGYAWGGADVDSSGNSTPGGTSVIGWIDFAPTVGGVPVGVQLAAPPCAVAEVSSWGTCAPVAQCTTGSPVGPTSVSGIQVGVCTGGSTVTRGCTVSQTCSAPSGATTKTRFWRF